MALKECADRSAKDRILGYHERTRHLLDRPSRSLGYLDWKNQPDPFRRFAGAPFLSLDLPVPPAIPTYDDLFHGSWPLSSPVDQRSVSLFFFLSLALSAWKEVPGVAPWALRVNPSSGNLHPTEGYLVAGPVEGLDPRPGVYHYAPREHGLEKRRSLSQEDWNALSARLPEDAFFVALTSIYWRESWKYGERAFRYCHHDVGHALGSLSFAAAILGWECRLVESLSDREVALLLGIDGQKGPAAEHAHALVLVRPLQKTGSGAIGRVSLAVPMKERLALDPPLGRENPLSLECHPWPVIEEVSLATEFPGMARDRWVDKARPPVKGASCRTLSAAAIIRGRRSALAMDGEAFMTRADFMGIVDRLSSTAFPFSVLPQEPLIALVLFVHRVQDLSPGLYLLARREEHRASLQGAMDPAFVWEPVQGADLHLLKQMDARLAAAEASCHQEIAGEGIFAVAMLAPVADAIERYGAWIYPRLFWEAGLIGQVLYLEAEAAKFQGCGIGCFYDETVQHLLGLGGSGWQSLYHFTVGQGVTDPRVRTSPPYCDR